MEMSDKIILDLCGGTGAWSKPYRNAGYDVRLITFPEFDVRLVKYPGQVYGVLAAPPCTKLARSGARWWNKHDDSELLDALSVVDACMRIVLMSQPVFWAVENPVGRLVHYLGKPRMYFDPCDYGDPWTKKTCLWGVFNEPRKSSVKPEKNSRVHYMPPGSHRSALRSITPPGFAKAFFEANR